MRTAYGKLVALALALTLAVLFFAPMRQDNGEFINLYPQSLRMNPGDRYALEAQLFADEPQNLRYSSSNNRVAIVSPTGEVVAVSPGSARIRVSAEGGARASMKVDVANTAGTYALLSLNTDAMDMEKGQISGLRAIFDEAAESTLVEWSSEDDTVARVDAIGRVQAVGGGTTRVVARTPNGLSASARINVHVTGTAMRITPSDLTVGEGANFALRAFYLPADATDAIQRWDSSNDRVLSVQQDGVIHAVGEGQAVISVFSENGLFGSTLVKVEKAAQGFEISPTAVTIERGNSLRLEPRFLDSRGKPLDEPSDHYIAWTSSNPDVAVVNNGEIVGLQSGTTRITASVDGMSASCELRVEILVHEVVFDQKEVTLRRSEARTPIQLTASCVPADADNQALTWSTSNDLVATVSQDGLVTMRGGYGTAVITARAASGAEAHFTVNVVTDAQ